MRRTMVIMFTVAILGGLSMYAKNHQTAASSPISTATRSSSPVASNTTQTQSSSSTKSGYKNGTFTGDTSQTPYGPVQIAAVINGGKITDINFLQLPSDLSHSAELSSYAAPYLKQSTLQAQSANIDFVSGATSTSYGYEQSLQSALDQAAGGSSSNSGSSSGTGSSTSPTNNSQGSNAPYNPYNGYDN